MMASVNRLGTCLDPSSLIVGTGICRSSPVDLLDLMWVAPLFSIAPP